MKWWSTLGVLGVIRLVIWVLICLDDFGIVGPRIGFVVTGEFESSKEGFSVLWETLSIICLDHCFFLSNFINFIVYENMFHLTFMGANVMRIGNFKLCVVSKCVELFVLFNFMGYSMYGDMFHPTLVENSFMRIKARFCKYWNSHKHDQWAHWEWNQNVLIPYDA
jgi:hypothetical protein